MSTDSLQIDQRTRIAVKNISAHDIYIGSVKAAAGAEVNILLASIQLSRLGRLRSSGQIAILGLYDRDGGTIAVVGPVSPPAPSPAPASPELAPKPEASAPVAVTEDDVLAAFAAAAPKKPAVILPDAPDAPEAFTEPAAPAAPSEPAAPSRTPEQIEARRKELDKDNMIELRAILDQRGIKHTDMRKADLVEAVLASDEVPNV